MTIITDITITAARYAAMLDENVDRLLSATTAEAEADARAFASRMWDQIEARGMKSDVMAEIHARHGMSYARGPR